VYIGETDGNVYALDASTGAGRVVRLHLPGRLGRSLASPAVANGVVYIGANDGSFWALNAATGAKV